MEEDDPATAILIASVVGAATTVGTTAFNAANAPGAPKAPSPADVTQNAIKAETQNRSGAVQEAAQLLPGLQANTSGGLSPDAYQQLSADFSGNAGLANSPQMQQLIARFLGTDTGGFGGNSPFGGGSTNFNPSSPGLAPG